MFDCLNGHVLLFFFNHIAATAHSQLSAVNSVTTMHYHHPKPRCEHIYSLLHFLMRQTLIFDK